MASMDVDKYLAEKYPATNCVECGRFIPEGDSSGEARIDHMPRCVPCCWLAARGDVPFVKGGRHARSAVAP